MTSAVKKKEIPCVLRKGKPADWMHRPPSGAAIVASHILVASVFATKRPLPGRPTDGSRLSDRRTNLVYGVASSADAWKILVANRYGIRDPISGYRLCLMGGISS
jgi:hypothetical protein